MAYTRSTNIPYSPASPPTTVDRAIWDEFFKIQDALIALDKPTSLAVTKQETMPVQSATVWTRLFDTPLTYLWEQPGSQMETTGVWTCPQEGLYDVNVVVEISAFPNPGSRIYTATLRTTYTPASGGASTTYNSVAGGPDEAALRFSANFLRPLYKGDKLTFDMDLTEENFTGSVNTLSVLNIVRQSSIK